MGKAITEQRLKQLAAARAVRNVGCRDEPSPGAMAVDEPVAEAANDQVGREQRPLLGKTLPVYICLCLFVALARSPEPATPARPSNPHRAAIEPAPLIACPPPGPLTRARSALRTQYLHRWRRPLRLRSSRGHAFGSGGRGPRR